MSCASSNSNSRKDRQLLHVCNRVINPKFFYGAVHVASSSYHSLPCCSHFTRSRARALQARTVGKRKERHVTAPTGIEENPGC